MSRLYGKQAIIAFLEGYLKSEFPISPSLRSRFDEAIIHLGQHDDFSDFKFNEQEVDEIFELLISFECSCVSLGKINRPDYFKYADDFVKNIFLSDMKDDPIKIFESDDFLSAETKSEYLKVAQQLTFIADYPIDLADKNSTALIQKFVKNLSKSEYEYIIKYLTRQASKNKKPVFYAFLLSIYKSNFLIDEDLINELFPYCRFLVGQGILNLKILNALKKIYEGKNLRLETKDNIKKHFYKRCSFNSSSNKKVIEIRQTIESFLVDVQRGEDDERLVWPLNDVIEVKSLLRPHTRDHVKWPSKIHLQIKELPTREMSAWFAIWQHAATATSVKPSAKWLKTAKELCTYVRVVLDQYLIEWIRLVLRESPTYCEPFSPQNANAMRGLVWFCVYMEHPDKAKLMMDVVSFGYQKLENKGPRSAIFANAALYVLGEMGVAGVVYLSQLRKKIKYTKAQEQIEKMLIATATKLGMTTDQLEDLAVPEFDGFYGGEKSYQVGDYQATLQLNAAQSVRMIWQHQGKTLASAPQAAKNPLYKSTLNQIKQEQKELALVLDTQSKRLEDSILQRRTWTYDGWQNQLVNTQILGWLAQRLVWQFEADGQLQHGFYTAGQWCDVAGQPLLHLTEQTIVRVWHPIFSTAEEVLAWRQLLINRQIVQPFKQAFREVYIPTPAELEAGNQSMRYAGHYLKQFQLKALCEARGWGYKLQGGWHDIDSPYRYLEKYDRISAWISVLAEHGEPQSASGVFLYVKTEEVQFSQNTPVEQDGELKYRHERLALAEVPPLVFSEIMRDIDLFVGVCSIGTDATLGQAETDHQGMRDYWQNSRFADLTASALVRKDTLDMIISKLAIAPQCRFEGKYLQVEGKLRSYKIHLGSGNILMSPNDQYLCIVSDHKKALHALDQMYLPFEGDQMLSLILSKALLLAADDQITDRSIVQQIQPS